MLLKKEDLKSILTRIDGKGYKAYKDIEGSFDYGSFLLHIDHVQGDPFAAPSRVRVCVPLKRTGFPTFLFDRRIKRIALQDLIARQFEAVRSRVTRGHRGAGRSGTIQIDSGKQEILERSSVSILGQEVEIRFTVGLPAEGRRILGKEATAIFFQEIPPLIEQTLNYSFYDPTITKNHVEVAEDQEKIRQQLEQKGLVAFIGNMSILPRRSGIDDRPLTKDVVPFYSPLELEVEMELSNGSKIKGMGIPRGVTLIVGGGFHGKTTLLNAIERGVYPHISGDGREYVVTLSSAVKIRAEDGRSVEKVNISPFINHLPQGKDTFRFSTENASGSTSQASNIMEALEMGSKLLLIDEDTSATNFMIRDQRMQELVTKEKEPITPFVDKVRQLYRDHGVSTILVMGGSGDYFDVADTVLMMDHYQPSCVTERAKEIALRHSSKRVNEGGDHFGPITPRQPLAHSFDASRGRRDVKIDAKGLKTLLYGSTTIDLSCLEQLVDFAQTRTIGFMIHYYGEHYLEKTKNLREGLSKVMEDVVEKGFDILLPYKVGNLAMPRLYEVAGAINRMRTLKIK
ncbi:MAG: ABC-ATPase domain-containing protein [Thermodesulfobacteriota bacterium]